MLQNIATESVTKATAGRPRSFDAYEILDRALELFWRNGYRATTTRDLESSLGLSQSSMYNAFGSKHDLLMAAMDRYEYQIDRDIVAPLEASKGGLDAIDRFFVDLTHWVTHEGRRGCMIINLMAEDGGDNDEITERTRAYRSRVRTALRDAVERAVAAGEATPGDSDRRADLLYGIILGLNIAARGGAAADEINHLLTGAHGAVDEWRFL